jgi:Glycosyltransferase family 87
MESSRRAVAWTAVAVASGGFVLEAIVAATPGSPLQPVLAPGAEPGGPFVWIGRGVGLDRLGAAFPIVSVIAVVLALAGFLVLLMAAWRGQITPGVVLALAVAFHAALLLLPLVISRDVYSYIAHGQIVSLHGENPYVATPADFPGLLTRVLVGPKWVDTPSVYGPLFSHLAGVVTRLSSRLDTLVDAFRVIAIAASLATTFVIGATVRRARPERAAFAVAAFGLNPAILFQSAASGHNDLLVALSIAIAAWLVLRDRTMWAVAALTLGALVKATGFLPLLLLVAWAAWRRRRDQRVRALAAHAGLAVAIVAVVAAPFLQLQDPTLGMLELAGHEGWLAPSRFFGRILDAVSGDTLGAVARAAFAVTMAVAAIWLVRALARRSSEGAPPDELVAGWGWSLLALALLGPVLLPWYLAWSLPLVWALPSVPRITLIALSAVLALSQWTAEPLRYPDAYGVSVNVGRYVLTPIVIGLLIWAGADLCRRLARGAPLRDEEAGETAEARQPGRGDRDAPAFES